MDTITMEKELRRSHCRRSGHSPFGVATASWGCSPRLPEVIEALKPSGHVSPLTLYASPSAARKAERHPE